MPSAVRVEPRAGADPAQVAQRHSAQGGPGEGLAEHRVGRPAHDLCAIGLLDIVLREGLTVPGDLSIIGYDDSRFGRLPGIDLTAVRQDIRKQARAAIKAVVERLDRPTRKPKNIAPNHS